MGAALIIWLLSTIPPMFTGGTWYVGESNTDRFDAVPPDTVSVLMTPDGDQWSRCDDIGGHLVRGFICRDVDY